ncbi:MAG TPA: M1 family metallopeptidase [Candidatus Chromulinivoraceae bacterium]|nr:M1 family metallopeptidase [Candidatus Chromulinivoraceae bacterium]
MQTVSRLIEKFVPEHYQLSLDLKRVERTFSGIITMNGISTVPGGIAVHAKDLTITSVLVDGKKAEYSLGENDELTVTRADIAPGRHIVVFEFDGIITDALHGLYPCYYDDNGVKKELLMTQFESHHAREVFPCIDEPEAKAAYDIALTTEPDIIVLGNMPVHSQKLEDNRLITVFDTTPRMSSYLVAWMAGELHKRTAMTKRGVEVNVWATPAQKPTSLDFALDNAVKTIDFFETYFDTPYPLPKSDHVAVPDFSSGAMENWGLITYREVALLADPETTSISSKHYIATVVAHELSHQWFGNLVTMKWWNNLWLNESFATLMEYIAVDALHPDWNIWLDFSTTESILALRRDSLEGVQPVQVEVNHPDEISTLFDGAIVYAKGARLLRMCQQYIGHEAFQTGLKAYFTAHKYSNTEGNDLWSVLSQASGKDITKLMNTWISQSGYPVIEATVVDNKITLSQHQFFIGPHEPTQKIWPVPLNASDPQVPALLETPTLTVDYLDASTLRLNVGDSAHFITKYDDELLAKLIAQVRTGELAPLDRLQLLHEQTLLARGGIISSATLIPLIEAYQHETTEAVWDIISLALGELKKFVETDKTAEDQLRALAGRIARAQYERLGWEVKDAESETDTKLRANIIGMMIYSQEPSVLETAKKLYTDVSIDRLDPELRALIIGTAVRYTDSQRIIDTLVTQYRSTASSDLRQDIANGLTSTRDAVVVKRLLDLIPDASTVRPQDAGHWFVWLIRNRDGRVMAWQWMRDNWSWIEKTFGGDKSYDDYPRFAASALVTRQQLSEYRAFFGPLKDIPALTRVITIGASEIEGRVALLERDTIAVREALAKL